MSVMRRSYGGGSDVWRHPLHDRSIAGLAMTAGVATWAANWQVGVLIAGVVWLFVASVEAKPTRLLVLLVALGMVGGHRAHDAHEGLEPRSVGTFEGWSRLVDDPQPFGSATRVIMEIEGERFEMWARGRAIQIRVGDWRAGEFVHVHGNRRELKPDRSERVAWQHVVGEFRLDWVSDRVAGGPLARSSNRVRASIERGSRVLPGDDGSLFRGLVVGDDRDQPRVMIQRFRASGLSHLTAVSGQNVSFVLAAAGPLLKMLRPWWRWAATVGLILWFMSLTRFEPSIMRAGAMAAISATAYVLGRERAPARILGVVVTSLLLIDPLLVGSIGFWLSVGAAAGVAIVGPRLTRWLRPLGFVAMPVGITLGAQVGVVIPALLVFGRLPLVSIPANLLSVPVAGFVMLYGLPAGLLAGFVPPVAPVVMFPARVGVRWVDTIAVIGARLEPGGNTTWVGWGVVVLAIAAFAAMNRGRYDSSLIDR